MLLKSLLTFSFICAATASPIQARGLTESLVPNQVDDTISAFNLISDIKAIDDSVKQLNDTLNAYKNDLVDEVPLAQDLTAIHLAHSKAIQDAVLRLTPFNSTETRAILLYANTSMAKTIPSSLDNLKLKKSLLRGQEATILAGLNMLKQDQDSLSAALASRITGDAASAGVVNLDNTLQSAIDYFN